MTSRVRLAAATTALALLLAPVGCTARKPTVASTSERATPPKASPLSHPPYEAGRGTVTGILVRSQVSTYPAGSRQVQVPFDALVIKWTQNGKSGTSEFLINGAADLVDDGQARRQVTARDIVERVSAAGTGTFTVDYAGSDLLPTWYATPPSDFPYALVTTVSIDASR